MEDRVYWIWLSLCCTPDTSTFPKLLESFDSAKEIYDADIKTLSKCIGFNNSDRSLLDNKDLDRAKQIDAFCKKYNVGIVTYGDDEYPQRLKEIDTPPVLLYYRGILPDFDNRFFISAVGTRSLSDYGRRSSFRISYDLASAGAIIVSGMALGIDGVSLAGALSAGGVTVAVLGSGINVCYPQQHQRLAREIVKKGCVLTEYPPDTPPSKFHFPKRNRIISGLSSATVVFEGREKSGALITARYAQKQGRALYALPGSVGQVNSEVSNLLLKNGAKPCTSADDIVNDFYNDFPKSLNPFNLPKKLGVDMISTLTEYSVVALCPGDPVFYPPRPQRNEEKYASLSKENENTTENVHPDERHENTDSGTTALTFSPEAITVYKRIPTSGACSVESLVDDKIPFRVIMKYLLELKMASFIELLPGDMVIRKRK